MTKGCLWLLFFASTWQVFSGELQIQPESTFAVITHKAGLLSSLGHNHFIYAGDYDGSLMIEGEDPQSLKFQFSVPVAALMVDDPAAAKKWYPELEKAAVVDEAFSEVSEKDRGKITKSMLSKKQLHGDKFPTIEASIDAVKEKSGKVGDLETTHVLTLKLKIRDASQTIPVPAAVKIEDGTWHIRAVAAMKFSDFNIKPFSAMLGSVANDDQFHLFVDMIAK